MSWQIWGALAATLVSAPPAHALCIYDGELYAETAIPQEFGHSALVIRGEVLSVERLYFPDDYSNPDAEPGVIHHIRVDQVLKGEAPAELDHYSELNSGGFYMDAGTEYLLFLNAKTPDDWTIGAGVAPGAFRINYNCGQSSPWDDLSPEDRDLLNALAEGGAVAP